MTTFPRENGATGRLNIVLLGLVSFINDTSSKIILPLLPLLITQLGGGGFIVGLISGASDSVASLLKLYSGHLSDRASSRKGFVFAGYLVSSAAKLLFAFAGSWPQVLGLRMAERFGKGVRSAPRDALLAASTARGRRGRGFGIHRAMDSGGAVLGTAIAFVMYWNLGLGFGHIFMTAGAIGFLSLLPLLFVRERREQGPAPASATMAFRNLPPRLRRFTVVAFLFALANFSYMFFVLRSESAFSGRLAVGVPIVLYGLYNLSFTLFALPAGILSDRIGRKNVLLMGYGLFALVCIGFMAAHSLAPFTALFILFGLSYALVEATERAYVADLADPARRGTALGTYHMATSIAALPAGLVAGALWDIHPAATFLYGAVLAAAAMVLLKLQA
ncbi:MAG: MFS transporter [Gammaproteobacteria bacterium]